MNAKTISQQQAALEQHIHDRIDAKDVNVLCDYAAFAEHETEEEIIRNFLLGMLETCGKQLDFAIAEVATHNRRMAAAMRDLRDHLDQQRAAYTEYAARAILDEAKGIKA